MSTAEVARSLRRLDPRPIDPAPDAVLACTIVRNEVGRVGPWLDHHRALGVDRFLVVDHGSTDGTTDALLAQPDVHVWTSDLDFRSARYGAAFFEVLLGEHGVGHWTVIVDSDELFVYPGSEDRPVTDLCAHLRGEEARAYSAVLLDLYAQAPLAATFLPTDRSPLAVAHWFDRRWRHLEVRDSGPYQNQVGVFGGVRRRLFGGDAWEYCLSKVALVHAGPGLHLVGGQHWTDLPLGAERGAVLHFKLTAALADFAWDELARGQRHPGDEYHRYAEALALDPDLTAFSPTESIRYDGTAQLVELGIMGPVADPTLRDARAEALTAHATDRWSAGDVDRAVALLERAATVAPTTVAPLLRLAEVHDGRGDAGAADRALAEACARRPEDLDLVARTVAGPPPPPDLDPMGLPGTAGVTVVPSVDAAFGPWARVAPPDGPWVGLVHGTVTAPDHLPPYREFALTALVDRPGFRAALDRCRGLVTFTTAAAHFLRERTGVPVTVVTPPVVEHPIAFDPERFAAAPTMVQPGWWMTRLATVCDLTVAPGVGKVRCWDDRSERIAAVLARVQRRHDGWPVDPAPLRATTDLGGVPPARLHSLIADAVVIADLIDANADPVVLTCLGRAVPIAVPALPGVVEVLGPGYPLHVERPADGADLLGDAGRVRAAHEHLRDRRAALAPARFAAALDAVWDGAP